VTAAAVSLVRVALVALLFGNAMSLAYSVADAVLSLAVMILLQRLDFLSTVGVSVAGGVMHNVGQILMAMLLLGTAELGYYLVVLAITGTIAGVLIGLAGHILIRRIPSLW
jgi:heptaprenyl diphosphate synthase